MNPDEEPPLKEPWRWAHLTLEQRWKRAKLERQSDEMIERARVRLRAAMDEAKRRGVPLAEIIRVH